MSSSGLPRDATSPGTPPAKTLAKVTWLELLCWLLRRRRRFRVSGRSMTPLLHPGDEVLVAPKARVRPGDIIVARHPFRQDLELIKLVTHVDADGRVRLEGLNSAESSDSRTLGTISPELIRGRVSSRF